MFWCHFADLSLQRKAALKCRLVLAGDGSCVTAVQRGMSQCFRGLVAKLPRGQVPCRVTVIRVPHGANFLQPDQYHIRLNVLFVRLHQRLITLLTVRFVFGLPCCVLVGRLVECGRGWDCLACVRFGGAGLEVWTC